MNIPLNPEKLAEIEEEVDRVRCYFRPCTKDPTWEVRFHWSKHAYGNQVEVIRVCKDHLPDLKNHGTVLDLKRYIVPSTP